MTNNNNKKVLHLIASLGNGGAERQLIELLKKNNQHFLCSFSEAGVYEKKIKKLGITLIELKVKHPIFIFLKIYKIIKVIRKYKIDMVHAWMYNACIVSVIVKYLSRKKKVKILWGIRCSNMNVNYYSLQLRINLYFCKIFSRLADQIIYNSYSGFDYHRSIGFSNENDCVIQNGIDSKKFKFCYINRQNLRQRYGLSKDKKVILCVARVDPMKGHKELLSAFARVVNKSRLKLILIGKGTEVFKNSKDVLALGMINNVEVYYSMADFIIIPSIFGEGFSNVLVEGMLCKLFPISSDVGDNKSIIEKTGITFSPNDELLIEKALNKVISMKNKDIKNYSEKAFLRAKKKYDISKMIRSYEKTYQAIS